MLTKQFSFIIISPIINYGANPKRSVEVREQSFKGIMRWWFRCIWGSSFLNNFHSNNLALKKLYEAESFVFGDTKSKSKFSLRIENRYLLSTSTIKALPHKTNSFKINAISNDQMLNIRIMIIDNSYVPYLEEIKIENIVNIIMTYISLLGGIGRRMRRGFGSLQYKEHINISESKFIALVKNNILNNVSKFPTIQPSFPVIKEIYVCKPKNGKWYDWDSALKSIGLTMRNFKNNVWGMANPRQASPVIIQIKKIQNELFLIGTICKYDLKVNDYDWEKVHNFFNSFNIMERIVC